MWKLLRGAFGNREDIRFQSYEKMGKVSLSRSGYYKKLKRLQKLGLIKKEKSSGSNVFVFTSKAKFLRSKPITKQRRTDGFSTLIIFDIHEKKHNARDTLRRYLIRNGYTQIKESCFLSPFQISTDMKDLIDELELNSDISVFAAKMDLLWT